MAPIEFKEEKSLPLQTVGRPQGLFAFIIGLGLAKNEKEAQTILIGVSIALFLIAFAIPFFITTGATYTKPTEQQVQNAFKQAQ